MERIDGVIAATAYVVNRLDERVSRENNTKGTLAALLIPALFLGFVFGIAVGIRLTQ